MTTEGAHPDPEHHPADPPEEAPPFELMFPFSAEPELYPRERLEVFPESLRLPDPGFWAAVGWSLLALLGPIVAGCCIGAAIGVVLRGRGELPDRGFLLVVSEVASSAVMLAIVGLNLRSRARRALALRGICGLHFLLVFLLVLPSLVLSDEIANLAAKGLDAVFGPQKQALGAAASLTPAGAYIQLIDQMFEALAKLPWPLALLLGCLLPGVVEEVFFRGFIGRGLVARYGAVLGVLLTTLLFALMHIDPVQISYTMVLGVVLHLVFLTTKSLLGPIVLHTLYNALGVSRMKLAIEGILTFAGPSGEIVIPPLLVAASFTVVIVLCWLLYRTRVRWVLDDGREWSPGYVTAEMHGFEPAVPRRRALRAGPALLAAGTYLAFGVLFAQAAAGWLGQGAALDHVRRAEAYLDKREYDQAVAACNEAIRLDSQLVPAYLVRGEAYRLKGLYDQSRADCETALRLDPGNALAFANRGEIYRLQQDYDRAMADCNRALQLDGRLAWAYSIRGAIHDDRKEYARAVVNWDESLRLEPNHAWTNTRLAWLLATCPEGRHRQGQRSVTLARRACELTKWQDADALAALAAAHAECGQFPDAIRWQEKAVGLASSQQKQFYSALRNLYQTGQPFREER